MQNLEEDLKEECLVSPINMKKLIYRQPMKFEYPCVIPKPSKGKVYDMNEKFNYVLDRIAEEWRYDFNKLPEKSKDRIVKLFNAYHEWQWPLWSNKLHRMGKELNQDVTRLARLLQQAKLITNNKEMLGGTPYQWNKLAFTSEQVLETLIARRAELTEWEKNYYTCANRGKRKSRAKKSDSVLKNRREKIGEAIDNSAFNVQEDEQMDKAFEEIEEKEQLIEDEDREWEKEHLNFIEMLNERYYMFIDIFPDSSIRELQKIFLTLILSEYEK